MDNPNIIKLVSSNKKHIEAVSDLHMTLLPDSVITKLGKKFTSQFYYKTLTKNNLMDVYLYKIDDKFVGFIACTDYPFTFMKRGMKSNFLGLLLILTGSLLMKPSRIKTLLNMKDDINADGLKKMEDENTGYFMSFGVLEEYRKQLDVFQNITITNVMMRKVFDHFTKKDRESFFLLVLKSNKHAVAFYRMYDGIFLSDETSKSDIVKFELPVEF